MKVEKWRNKYRIRKMYKGKTYTAILDYKPTQKEAMEIITRLMNDVKTTGCPVTFCEAYNDYVSSQTHILSPSTIHSYYVQFNRFTEAFKNKRISDITYLDVQKELNNISSQYSPHTTRAACYKCLVVLKAYGNKIDIDDINLPQSTKKEPYIPTEQDVRMILDELKGTNYYIPVCLACLSLRRGEICALTIDDLSDDNYITINKSLVPDKNGGYTLFKTKTPGSNRKVLIPQSLADEIRQQGYIYKGHPCYLSEKLKIVQTKLGIPYFSIHKLRHFFATYSHNDLHLSDKQIMEVGGWASLQVLNQVYKHASHQEEARQAIAEGFGNIF